MNTFTENQKLVGQWLWVITGICFLIAGGTFLIGPPLAGWLILLIVSFVSILFRGRQLDTRYDETGVHVRLSLVADWHTIRWEDVAKYTITTYPKRGSNERFGEWLYTMSGNWGLRIETKTGKRILIGTQRPDELRAFLATLPGLQPANN